jgi:PAS domain S-box-containing protein
MKEQARPTLSLKIDDLPVPALIFALDNNKPLSANKAALEFFGSDLSDLQKRDFSYAFGKPSSKKPSWCLTKDSSDEILLGFIDKKNKRDKRALAREEHFFSQGIEYRLWLFFDMTEFYESKSADSINSRKTENLLQSILDNNPVPIFWKDAERRFLGANKAFLDYYGFSSVEEIIGKNDEDMGWHPDPSPYKNDEVRVIQKGEKTHRTPGVCLSHNLPRNIVASKSPLYEGKKIVGLVGSFEDVTEETRAKEKVIQLNEELEGALKDAERASRYKTTFLSNVSHDMRTPLNGILGFASLALKETDPAKKDEYIKRIITSGNFLSGLINDTLELSKAENGKHDLDWEICSAEDLLIPIINTISASAKAKGISFSEYVDPTGSHFFKADKISVQKILMNLLSNAVKFTKPGGQVSLRITVEKVLAASKEYAIEVKDSGIGMSQEFQSRLFQPFSQENDPQVTGIEGTGLGLSIAKHLIDLMGGKIKVESEKGHGTTLTVYLTLEDVKDYKPPRQENLSVESLEGKKVLLCEDNFLNIQIESAYLSNKGLLVSVGRNGQEGLEKYLAAPSFTFAAILMDIRMPIMDGLEATSKIRASGKQDALTIPIIGLSADAFKEDIMTAKAAGMNDYVTKPIDVDKLTSTLVRFLSGLKAE